MPAGASFSMTMALGGFPSAIGFCSPGWDRLASNKFRYNMGPHIMGRFHMGMRFTAHCSWGLIVLTRLKPMV